MLLFEMTVLVFTAVLCLTLPVGRGRVVEVLERRWRAAARRPFVCIGGIGLAVLLVEMAVGWLVYTPQPALHDEFSYWLAGDTFAAFRLTNPTHPLWEHFESYNIILRPTYQSKYPPGQGLTLALGSALAGEPILGVWLTLALACAAVTWMAYAWLPPRWALCAGLLMALNFRLLRFWGQTYMGGGLALLGGALLFGALRRVIRDQRPRDAALLAVGCLLLALSRPYEGLLASLCAAAALLVWLCSSKRPAWTVVARRVVLPAAGVLVLGFFWMGYYHYRVTGNPWKMPYQVWLETYAYEDSLWSVVVRPGEDQIPESRPARQVGTERTEADWRLWFTRRGATWRKLSGHWGFYVGLTLTPALLLAPGSGRRRWLLFALLTCVVVVVAILMQNTHGHAHYAAPVGGLIAVLLADGLRQLRLIFRRSPWRRLRRFGRRFSLALPALLAANCLVYAALVWIPQPLLPGMEWVAQRAKLQRQLERAGGRHVVLVHHAHSSETGVYWREWVYNRADIDGADIVWARDLGAQRNQRLMDYYAGRRIWLLDLERNRLTAVPRDNGLSSHAAAPR